ncbi:UvrD-helicase domain-containing protein [Halobacillus litoralis]|uniref:UvrD-helicase domain-containing protein n=1 Tax=Halobacillus litoralis TaxID=45668 RepID=UPI001CD7347B|nr:UvrD-helicase domain-containing protein [Halobacillus litoralis]MCA1022130.1 UvrD-helicase domain-containing protein [Halobacillus litoralis]
MNIVVAGAGAGKTTSMAEVVISRLHNMETKGKIIYVISYTNSARDRIKEKIIKNHGSIPSQVKVETIHSFLLREVIYPFHHLIYGHILKSASHIPLSSNHIFKAKKKKELKDSNIIHVEDVTKNAKYILCGKSSDTVKIKSKRENALRMISRYLDSIFVDESQDMDDAFSEVLAMLDHHNIGVNLIGDPKQDLRNRGAFREIISGDIPVKYLPDNHRCPIELVDFSNSYIAEEERQFSIKEGGILRFVMESNCDIKKEVESGLYDLVYIYQKNARFITHKQDQISKANHLFYELKVLTTKSSIIKEIYTDQHAYVLLRKTINAIKTNVNTNAIFRGLEKDLSIVMDSPDKGKIGGAIGEYRSMLSDEPGILVSSIDGVKGLEGDNCLFIVSTQLAPYLFKEDVDQNKMVNYLYVALTRSRRNLTIMVTREVEKKYGHQHIYQQFKNLGIEEIRP